MSKYNWKETLPEPGTPVHINFCCYGSCPDLHCLLVTSVQINTCSFSFAGGRRDLVFYRKSWEG